MLGVLNLFNIIPEMQELYDRYLEEVQPLLTRYNSRILFYGKTLIVCLGDYTQEYCGLVIYPDMKAVKGLSNDPDFKRIRILRDESTTDFEMVILDEVQLD
ncbi:DUF1330 domain-containing protein [Planctomycetota bacterium]